MGTVLCAPNLSDRDDEEGEYRICSKCRHLFWSVWDDNDNPNCACPYCDSNETALVGLDSESDQDMQKIWAKHPEDNPIIGKDEFQFRNYPEAN